MLDPFYLHQFGVSLHRIFLFFTGLMSRNLILLSFFLLLAPITPARAVPDDSRQIAEALSRAFGRASKGIMPSIVNIEVSVDEPTSSSSAAGRSSSSSGRGAHGKGSSSSAVGSSSGASSSSGGSSSGGSASGSSSSSAEEGDPHGMFGSGTGVIVDEDGFILTNNHVIQDADTVTVKLFDKRALKGEVIGQEVKSDLAVIKIEADDLDPAPLGDSDKVIVGQWVIAAGNPFGLTNSITAGIISAYGRALISGAPEMEFIQTDAAINPGNSGGPLINLDGEVVGINTAIFSRSGGYMGIGFAIPVNRAKAVMQGIIDKYKSDHPQ